MLRLQSAWILHLVQLSHVPDVLRGTGRDPASIPLFRAHNAMRISKLDINVVLLFDIDFQQLRISVRAAFDN